MDSGAWVEIVDEWGQASWRNSLTGGLSWQNPSAKDPGSKIAVQAPNVPSKNIRGGNPTVAEDSKPAHSPALLSDGDDSGSDEDVPSSGESLTFFSKREEHRRAQLERREKIAVIAARQALTFLEETASSSRGHAMAGRRPEDDTPAFVDVEALRGLAAGEDSWKYISRKDRQAIKIRAEAQRIADEKEARATGDVSSPRLFSLEIMK